MNRTVVVFGATSFVGSETLPVLLAQGHSVVAVTRRPSLAKLVLKEAAGLTMVTPPEVPTEVDGKEFDIVNLAYVKDAPTSRMYEANRRLITEIEQVARLGCRRLVHISTAAVFGYRFKQTPAPVRAKWRPLGPYPESKIHAERLVERMTTAADTDGVIVRLGNVLGPGAPTWTASVAQRILEGKPVSYVDEPGFLNGTHVANVADYIGYLLGVAEPVSTGCGIHHLAEFSAHRWPELLSEMSMAMGRQWREASRRQHTAPTAARAKTMLKQAYVGVPGSYARAAMGTLPAMGILDRMMDEVKIAPPPGAGSGPPQASLDDEEILEILSSKYEFPSATQPGWVPPIAFDKTCSDTATWLRDASFALDLP